MTGSDKRNSPQYSEGTPPHMVLSTAAAAGRQDRSVVLSACCLLSAICEKKNRKYFIRKNFPSLNSSYLSPPAKKLGELATRDTRHGSRRNIDDSDRTVELYPPFCFLAKVGVRRGPKPDPNLTNVSTHIGSKPVFALCRGLPQACDFEHSLTFNLEQDSI